MVATKAAKQKTELPKLAWRESPNQSSRSPGIAPYLIVAHRPVGNYHGSADWLCNRKAQASAHILTEGNGTGVDEATQLVAWDRKAWACATFNSASYNIEVDDNAWDGTDPGAFQTAARIFAFICNQTGIPATHSKNPLHQPGIVRHVDLGRAGGGHTDPTQDNALWRAFLKAVQRELDRGGFRKTWGRGKLQRIDV
jgi:N-acetyl-anhydromuramyl-L-alanine amidase AmpD